jgi:hypothetical protein
MLHVAWLFSMLSIRLESIAISRLPPQLSFSVNFHPFTQSKKMFAERKFAGRRQVFGQGLGFWDVAATRLAVTTFPGRSSICHRAGQQDDSLWTVDNPEDLISFAVISVIATVAAARQVSSRHERCVNTSNTSSRACLWHIQNST